MSLSLNSKTLCPSLINPLFNLLPVLKKSLPSCLSLKFVTCKILKLFRRFNFKLLLEIACFKSLSL